MHIRTVIAMFAGVLLGSSVTIAVRSLPLRGVPKVAPANKCQIVNIATEWYKSHFKGISLSMPTAVGDDVVVTGEKAYHREDTLRYRFEVVISSSNETIRVCGICPIDVGRERLGALREFAVRAACKMRESIATLYLDAKGALRCRATMPFDALLVDSDEAMWLMVGSVEEKLSNCEKAARRVCNDGLSPSAAVGEFDEIAAVPGNCPCYRAWVDIYKGHPRTEDIVKKWFDEEGGYYEMHHAGSDTKFSSVWRFEDGDAMGYGIEIGHQVLTSWCRNPIKFLYENSRDDEMCEFISRFNERNNSVSIIMDFDKGEMFFRHSMPVSVLRLPRTKERLQKTLSDITGVVYDAYWRTLKDIGLIIGAR